MPITRRTASGPRPGRLRFPRTASIPGVRLKTRFVSASAAYPSVPRWLAFWPSIATAATGKACPPSASRRSSTGPTAGIATSGHGRVQTPGQFPMRPAKHGTRSIRLPLSLLHPRLASSSFTPVPTPPTRDNTNECQLEFKCLIYNVTIVLRAPDGWHARMPHAKRRGR